MLGKLGWNFFFFKRCAPRYSPPSVALSTMVLGWHMCSYLKTVFKLELQKCLNIWTFKRLSILIGCEVKFRWQIWGKSKHVKEVWSGASKMSIRRTFTMALMLFPGLLKGSCQQKANILLSSWPQGLKKKTLCKRGKFSWFFVVKRWNWVKMLCAAGFPEEY